MQTRAHVYRRIHGWDLATRHQVQTELSRWSPGTCEIEESLLADGYIPTPARSSLFLAGVDLYVAVDHRNFSRVAVLSFDVEEVVLLPTVADLVAFLAELSPTVNLLSDRAAD